VLDDAPTSGHIMQARQCGHELSGLVLAEPGETQAVDAFKFGHVSSVSCLSVSM
jgi:hypothetical protein